MCQALLLYFYPVAGIYLHIPFCKQACHYCDFHFSTQLANKSALVDALIKEIDLSRDYLKHEEVSTIYFGGGTPSLLTGDEIGRLMEAIHNRHTVSSDAEITLEANPDDLTMHKLAELKSAAINRLSIGIQSFHDRDLTLMNRAHTAAEADYCVKLAQDKGFENITIDLIYSIPGQSINQWKENLKVAFELSIPHISAYSLTIEPRTVFGHYAKRKTMQPVEQEASEEQFLTMLTMMRDNDFEQYEVSNFCRPGWESRHNTSYWSGKKYLGLGPSAHSFDGLSRQWNIPNNHQYMRLINEGEIPFEREELDQRTRLNEYLMTGLRMRKGIDLQHIRECFDFDLYSHYQELIDRWMHDGKLTYNSPILALTDSGMLMADRIASDFFVLEK